MTLALPDQRAEQSASGKPQPLSMSNVRAVTMLIRGNSGQLEPCQSQNSHGHSWQPEPVHRQQLQQKDRLQMTGDNFTDGSLAPQQLPSCHAGTLGQACSPLPTSSSVGSIPSIPSSSSNVTSDSNCSAATSSTPTSASGSAVVLTVLDAPRSPADGVMTSIYDLYNTRKMYCIMTVVALAALAVPLSNTIFLPAMKAIQVDLHTSAAAVTSSVATFQIAIGLAALLWGPASDRFGRKPVLVLATVMFVLTNLPLIFAPGIGVLLAFRTLQGAAVAAYVAAGPAMLADICSPANRGTLFGVCSVAALLGPIFGPPLGGGLSQAFGWRSMFVLLAGLSALLILPLLLWFVPETLQHKVMQRLSHQQPAVALKVAEAATILEQDRPRFHAPWWPLRIVLDPAVVLHVSVMIVGYSMYMCSLAVLPFYLSRPPYSMATASIGAAYLPGALAAVLASPFGGKLADLAGRANPQQPLRRLVYSNLLGIPLMPFSILVLGWGLQKGLSLALPLVALFLTSFLNSLYMPALFTVLTMLKQSAAAAAVGGAYALLFLVSGTLMVAGTALTTALGVGPFLSILAAVYLCCTLAAFMQIIRACSDVQDLSSPLVSRCGSAAFARSAGRVLSMSLKRPEQPAAGAEAAPAGRCKVAGVRPGCGCAGTAGSKSGSKHMWGGVHSGELSAQPTEKDASRCAGVPGPSAQQVCSGRCPAVQDRRDRSDEEVV